MNEAQRTIRTLGWSMIIAACGTFFMFAMYLAERHRPHPNLCPQPVGMELPGFAPPHPMTVSRAIWPQQYVIGRRVWRV